MKYRTSVKALREGCSNLWYTGYAELQFLLRNHDAVAYTCGVYGWNFDVNEVYGLTICTGYRGMPGKRLDWDMVREYEKKAAKIWDWSYTVPFEQKQKEVEKLLKEFCLKNGGLERIYM